MTKVLEQFLANGGQIQKLPPGAAFGVRALAERGQRVGSIRGHRARTRAWQDLEGRRAFGRK